MNNRIKNIVANGIYNGIAYNSIISSIAFEIATQEEFELLELWTDVNDIPELKARAEELYNKYKEEYYKTIAQ